MTPAVRTAALSDLRDAREAERAGDWRAAYYLRQMVAFSLHIEDETRRAVWVHRGARERYDYLRTHARTPADLAFEEYRQRNIYHARAARRRVMGVRPATLEKFKAQADEWLSARVGGWADPDTLD